MFFVWMLEEMIWLVLMIVDWGDFDGLFFDEVLCVVFG